MPSENVGHGDAVDLDAADEDGHLFAVPAVRAATGDFALQNAEVLRQSGLQARAVQRGQGGDAPGGESGMHQRGQARDVRGVENDDDKLAIWAVLFDVQAELLGISALSRRRSSRVMPSLRGAPPELMT